MMTGPLAHADFADDKSEIGERVWMGLEIESVWMMTGPFPWLTLLEAELGSLVQK